MTRTRKALPFLALALASGMLSAQTAERLASRLDALCAAKGLNAEQSLKVSRTHMDGDVPVHHLQQYYRGVKVWGALTNVREIAGELRVAAQKVLREVSIGIVPSLSATEIRNLVDADLNRGLHYLPHLRPSVHAKIDANEVPIDIPEREELFKTRYLAEPEVEVVIFPVEEQRVRPEAAHKSADQVNAEDVAYVVTGYRLAYHVATDAEVKGRRELMNYLVDAHSGEIIEKWNMVLRGAVAGTAKTKYAGNVTLYTNQNGSTYEAKDPTYFNNYVSSSSSSSTPYTDADNVWGNNGNWADGTTEAKQTGAAEALYVLQRECQMLKAVWGRNGSSGTGKAHKIVWGQYAASNTGCYVGQDYTVSGYADSYFYDMNKLDIIGHEYGHSFDYYTANLCGNSTGEGGGMSEAHADIMGLLTEVYGKYATNDPNNPATTIPEAGLNDPKTWICGEDAAKSNVNGGAGLRFFTKPSKDTMEGTIDAWKSTMSSVEVHAAAGPTDRMFYYLAVGAPSSTSHQGYTSYLPNGSTGVGLHKAANIWVKTMLGGGLSSSSKHIDARNACINTAKSIYSAGGPEEQAVWNAYAGINVGQPWNSSGVTVSISPTTATIQTGATYQFNAAVTGTTNTSVTWTCSVGSVSTSGLYTAPVTAGTYTVTATSAADSTKKATATVTVYSNNGTTYNEVEGNDSTSAANAVFDTATKIVGYIGTSTDNDYFKINVGAGVTLTVNMTGPAKDYDLYLYNASGTKLKSSEGSTATESVSYANSGTSATYYYVQVKGYNGACTTGTPYNLALTKSNTPTSVSVAINPTSSTLTPGSTKQFTATVSGSTNTSVTWTCTGGTVNTSGLYTAPSTTGTYTVKATSVADTSKSASATVSVSSNTGTTYNEVEDNGSISAANAVTDTSNKIVGYIGTSTDNDYFKVLVGAGRTLTVNMTGPAKDYDLYLYNASGTQLKVSQGSTATETVSYQNTGSAAVYYYIRVMGYGGAYTTTTPYNLALSR